MIKGIKLQAREMVIIYAAILVLVGYLFYTFWFSPYEEKIVKNNESCRKVQADIKKNDTMFAKAKEIEENKSEVESQAKKLQIQLPVVESMLSVMADVKAILSTAGVEVKRLDLGNGAPKKDLDTALDYRVAKVTFSGSYQALYAGVNSLESTDSPRTFKVADITMNSKNGISVEGSMTVEMYFTKTPLAGYEYTPVVETRGKSNPFSS